MSRELSDHTPLLLDTGVNTPKQPIFRFELGWLLRDGFYDMVADVWRKEVKGGTELERWQNRIRRVHQFLRGWAKNTSGAYKKEKANLLAKADELDKKAEMQCLSEQ